MTLTEVADQLRSTDKKVQLIYAFNGTGKTRLSREFKRLIVPKIDNVGEDNGVELSRSKYMYYSAFTEDLFYWDNDLEEDVEPKLRIQPNTFTDWVLKDQGQDMNVVTTFQRYADDKLTPHFNTERIEMIEGNRSITVKAFSEVTFTMERGDATHSGNLKISKGEESNFIWSIFYALLEQVIDVLNVAEPENRETDQFDQLEYIFIDDPVSSLDDNHLIQLAVDLAYLVKQSESEVKFVITTHNPIFFNVLSNEFASDQKTEEYNWKSKYFRKYRLEKNQDNSLLLCDQRNDSPFSYHLHLVSQLQEAIESGQVEKYHFNLLRNILEKTATFLGYKRWDHLLPRTEDGFSNLYAARIINFSSHSKHSAEEVQPLNPEEKKVLERLLKHIVEKHHFWLE